MGIHFACHLCNHALHVKNFQGGKRGRCPECKGPFRIPFEDASYSVSLEALSEETQETRVNSIQVSKNSSQSSGAIALEADPKSLDSTERNRSSGVSRKKSEQSQHEAALKLPRAPSDMPVALSNCIDAKWFVRPPSGGQFGPASSELLMEWIRERRVTSDSFLWREGQIQWQSAGELIPELFAIGSAPGSSPEDRLDSIEIHRGQTEIDSVNSEAASGLVKKRQIKKRRQQMIAVAILGTISLILLVVLVLVLASQLSKG